MSPTQNDITLFLPLVIQVIIVHSRLKKHMHQNYTRYDCPFEYAVDAFHLDDDDFISEEIEELRVILQIAQIIREMEQVKMANEGEFSLEEKKQMMTWYHEQIAKLWKQLPEELSTEDIIKEYLWHLSKFEDKLISDGKMRGVHDALFKAPEWERSSSEVAHEPFSPLSLGPVMKEVDAAPILEVDHPSQVHSSNLDILARAFLFISLLGYLV